MEQGTETGLPARAYALQQALAGADEGGPVWPPRARALLDSARRLLLERGFSALTLENISKEANDHKATVRYYFGNKAGLIMALNELVNYEATNQLLEQVRDLPRDNRRLSAHIENTKRLIREPSMQAWIFDLLPYAFREDAALRHSMAEQFDWHRRMMIECFGIEGTPENVEKYRDLASFFLAAADGIIIQSILDPGRFDPDPLFRILETALRAQLSELREASPA